MRPELDRTTRDLVRELVDAAVRARVAAENAHIGTCVGCGMPHSDWTPGCKKCWGRHMRRRTLEGSPLHLLVLDKAAALNADAARVALMSDEMREAARQRMLQMHADGRIGTWATHREAAA